MKKQFILVKYYFILTILFFSSNKLSAQHLPYNPYFVCDFDFNININCLLFIKESELMRLNHNKIELFCNTSHNKALDSMRYAINIVELDSNKCKMKFTFKPISSAIPNSEQYLIYNFPVTHIYTLKTGYQMMVSFDKKVDIILAEKILNIRKLVDQDTILYKQKMWSYGFSNSPSGVVVYFESGEDNQKIIKGYPAMLRKKYLKYFSNYNAIKAKEYNKRMKKQLEQLY